jgi:hypothetical protein
MARSLTETAGNPAHAIRQAYNTLMGIKDVDALKDEARRVVAGTAFSRNNKEKFEKAVSTAPTLTRLQGYLTNFMLAADGMSVIA